MERHRLKTIDAVREFALAGNATLTLVSTATGARFTFRVRRRDVTTPYFVSLLRGPDNNLDYQYLGCVKEIDGSMHYHHGIKSRIGRDAPSARAFTWFWQRVRDGRLPQSLEIWHEGKCGRCGRKLTVPESLARGIGPECSGALRQRQFDLIGGHDAQVS